MLLSLYYSVIIATASAQTTEHCVVTTNSAHCSYVSEPADSTTITPMTQPAPSTVQTTDGADLQPDN